MLFGDQGTNYGVSRQHEHVVASYKAIGNDGKLIICSQLEIMLMLCLMHLHQKI